MEINDIYYAEEIRFSKNRLVMVLVFTTLGFLLFNSVDKNVASVLFSATTILGGLSIFSMLHYIFILRFPNALKSVRKNILIFFDLITVTYLTALFEAHGIFLLPLYIIIVTRSGLSYGINYFYTSIISAFISWLLLLYYSAYWQTQTDILATFVMTTLLIPFFFLKVISRIHEENSELSEKLEVTEYDANYDALTGAPNRKMYKEFIQEAINEKEFFTLLFIDLNKFKPINDTYGHNMGDSVLKEVAQRLKSSIDAQEDFFARLGGDEFVIITKRKKAFLKKFIENLEEQSIGNHTFEEHTVRIELSIGISMYPDDATTELMLNKNADDAMYVAKQNPNSYHAFYHEI